MTSRLLESTHIMSRKSFIMILLCLLGISASGGDRPVREWTTVGAHRYLWMEAESADVVLPSFVARRDPSVSGEVFLTVPEGAGTAAFDSGIGTASYTFHVPADGVYDVWARVLWESGCSNSFAVTVDDVGPQNLLYKRTNQAIGKDTTLATWHWVRHLRLKLTAGEHVFSLHNQDDGSSIDSLIITDDAGYQAEGVQPWFYTGTFTGGQADGWTVPDAWEVTTSAGESVLTKTAATAGSVMLADQVAATVYWAGDVRATEYFALQLGIDNGTTGTLVSWKSGTLTISGTSVTSATVELPRLSGRVEIWRSPARVDVALDGIRLLSAKATATAAGAIAFDGGAGTTVDNITTVPLLPLHAGANYYSQWNDWLVEDTVGDWARHPGDQALELRTPTGTAFIGRPWWQDYQLAFLFKLPDNGTLDVGICARTADDAHVLSITHDPLTLDFQQIARVRGGERTPLAKPLNAAMKNGYNLAVINVLDGRLQVYINGDKLFDLTDPELSGGRIFFRGTGAHLMQLDDIEAWSLTSLPVEGTWPSLRVHDALAIRRIHSVLDNRGAVGGIHPGFHSPNRDEPELRWLLSNHQSATPTPRARVIDYQWSAFGRAYEERYGDGKKQGWILARSIDPDTEHVLWSMLNAHGNWQLSWRSFGRADALGAVLYPWPTPAGDVPPQPLRIWIDPRENTLNVAQGEAEPTVVKLAGRWSEETWYDWELKCVDGDLIVRIGGQILHRQSLAALGTMVRPGLYFRHGRLYLDDIDLTFHPDIGYLFDFNYPYHLTLAGWDTNGIGSAPRFSGGYYCRMDLQHPAGHTYLRSRRAFQGDVTLETILTASSTESLSLSLLDAESGQPKLVLRLTGEHLDAWQGETRLGFGGMRPHSSGTSDMDTIRFRLHDGHAEIYLDDLAGSDRLALRVKVPDGTTDSPYYLQLDATPRLVVKKILIWNQADAPAAQAGE